MLPNRTVVTAIVDFPPKFNTYAIQSLVFHQLPYRKLFQTTRMSILLCFLKEAF